METDHDKPLTESDLSELLQIVAGLHFEDVGIELGLTKSNIDVIAMDNDNDPERCKTEILCTWLRNAENPTRQVVYAAVKRINDRRVAYRDIEIRQENKEGTVQEEKEAEESIEQLVTLFDDWEKANQKIVSDKQSLSAKLKKEEEWFSKSVKEWNDEDDEWQQGDTAKERAHIQEALQLRRNLTRSPFVKTFLENKDLKVNISEVSNKMADGFLRQALMDIDNIRLSQLGKHYREALFHFKLVEHLRTEISNCADLLEERLITYNKIKESLEKLGVRTGRLIEQIQALQVTAAECLSKKNQCEEIYQNENNSLCHWKKELDGLLKSFNSNITQMESKEKEFSDAVLAITTATAGAVTGAGIGASIGTGAAPVIGSMVGVLVGGAVGGTVGLIYGQYKRDQAKKNPIDHHVQNYRDTLEEGRNTMHKFTRLLSD